jgi:hypothetical protein
MSNNGINPVATSQSTTVRGNNQSNVLDTGFTGNVNTSTTGASTTSGTTSNRTAPNSTQDANDKTMARKYMEQAIQTTIAEQPVQQSGFCGLQNNSADINKAKTAAATQLSDIADQFMNSGISGSEALQIASQFVSQVKAAGGKAISSEQMLSLQQLVSNAARTDDSDTGSSITTSGTETSSACSASACAGSAPAASTKVPDCGFSSAGSRKSADETQDSTYLNTNRKSYVGDVTREAEQVA